MALPSDIQLVAVTCGSGSTFFGEDATVTVEVAPVLGGNLKHLVHKTTGSFMTKSKQTFTGEPGQPATFTVPNSSQPETWIDGTGAFFTGWGYLATIIVRAPNGETERWTKSFTPALGQTTIDLDLVPDGQIGGGVSAPVPPVTSVNGQTGAVVVEGGAEVTPEAVAANLPERLSETALSAAIVGQAVPAAQTAAADYLATTPAVSEAAATAATTAVQDVGLVTWEQGKNLFDPSKRSLGFVVASSGTLNAAPGYDTSDYIAVTAGQAYTLNQSRYVVFFDSNKAVGPWARLDNSSGDPATVTPEATGYIRVSVPVANIATFQVERGNTVTAYESYRRTLDPTFLVDASQVISTDPGESVHPLEAGIEAEYLTVTTGFDGGTLLMGMNLASNNNSLFNFNLVRLNGTDLAGVGDDIAPIRTQQGTIGANHGFPYVGVWPVGSHDKTTADLGSVWTDGTRQYVILAIASDGSCVVGGDYTTAGTGETSTALVSPTVPLTHVSGATHTTALSNTARTGGQLFPSVQRATRQVAIDGRPLGAAGKGSVVSVKESYDILDYASVYDTAKANIGFSYAALRILGAVRVESTWRIFPGGKLLGDFALTELMPTRLASGGTGFLQMARVNSSAIRYLPGVKPIGGLDWSAGVPITSLVTSQLVTTADLHNPAVPPVMLLDKYATFSTVIAYDPWRDATRNAARLASTPSRLWDLRNTGKVYPVALGDTPPGWGRLIAHGIRAYLTPTEAETVIAAGQDGLAASAALGVLLPDGS